MQPETDAVGHFLAVAMFSSEPAAGSGQRYASAPLPSFRLSGRGVFRQFSTARF